jgi:protein SCO1/2
MNLQSRLLKSSIYFVITFSLLCACAPTTHTWQGSPYDPPRKAPSIQIAHPTGDSFDLSEQAGIVTLLYFGYAYCPDVCPATLAILGQVFNELDITPAQAQVLMITVDPARETPESVAAYTRRFHPDFIGLWADEDTLQTIMQAYGVVAIQEPSDDPERYLITHTARVFLIDKQGFLRVHYPFGTTPQAFMTDLAYVLEEE